MQSIVQFPHHGKNLLVYVFSNHGVIGIITVVVLRYVSASCLAHTTCVRMRDLTTCL